MRTSDSFPARSARCSASAAASAEVRAIANASSSLSSVAGRPFSSTKLSRSSGSSQSWVLPRSSRERHLAAQSSDRSSGKPRAGEQTPARSTHVDFASVRNPRDFFAPMAIGAPQPLLEIPVRPSRMIHFLDFSNEKMVVKAPDIARQTDILLGNLEDAIPVDRKEAARAGLVKAAKESDLGQTALWTRVNSLESPWVLDDLTTLVTEIGDQLDVVMVPKVEGALGHPLRRPAPRPARGQGGPGPPDPRSTRSSRPRRVLSISRRSPPPARGCRE